MERDQMPDLSPTHPEIRRAVLTLDSSCKELEHKKNAMLKMSQSLDADRAKIGTSG